jgi:hypothetical protein
MAFVQVTLLKFKNDTDQSSIDAISEGLKSISNIVPGITKFEFGPDLLFLRMKRLGQNIAHTQNMKNLQARL